MMSNMYNLGWCTGSGGGISLRIPKTDTILVAPSGVNKEMLKPDDIIEMKLDGERISEYNGLKPSACLSIFTAVYKSSDTITSLSDTVTSMKAGAVIHSHSKSFISITNLFKDAFKVTNLEMIKGISGYSNNDVLSIPIIENTAHEIQLAEHVRAAMKAYPDTPAVLVRNHGVYVWGKDWEQCKIHAEVVDYLCEVVAGMMTSGAYGMTTGDVIDGVFTPRNGREGEKSVKPRVWRTWRPDRRESDGGGSSVEVCGVIDVGYCPRGMKCAGKCSDAAAAFPRNPTEMMSFSVIEEKLGIRHFPVEPHFSEESGLNKLKSCEFVGGVETRVDEAVKIAVGKGYVEEEGEDIRYVTSGGMYCVVCLPAEGEDVEEEEEEEGEYYKIQCKVGDVLYVPEGVKRGWCVDSDGACGYWKVPTKEKK
jgi:methylthioribulose-1-phosphate dehydratase